MTLKITTHSNEEFIVGVDDYNAAELNEQCNNHELSTIRVGDVIVSRINIKSISIVQDEATESAE